MESGNDVMTFSDNANVVKFVKQPRKTKGKSPIKYKSLDWNDVERNWGWGVLVASPLTPSPFFANLEKITE